MASNLATIAKALLASTKEPSAELCSAVSRLHLLIIFNIVKYDKAWSFATPLTATNLLLGPSGNKTKLMPVVALDDDVSFLVRDETFNFKVPDDIFVLSEFVGDIAQVFDGHVFARTDNNHVVIGTE
jgi:hypothetical protein